AFSALISAKPDEFLLARRLLRVEKRSSFHSRCQSGLFCEICGKNNYDLSSPVQLLHHYPKQHHGKRPQKSRPESGTRQVRTQIRQTAQRVRKKSEEPQTGHRHRPVGSQKRGREGSEKIVLQKIFR